MGYVVGFVFLIAACVIFLLGLFVYWRGTSARKLYGFFLLCLTSVVWLGLYGLAYLRLGNPDLLFKIGYVAVIFEAVVAYHLIVRFVGADRDMRWVRISYAIAFLFSAVHLLTPAIVAGHFEYFWGPYPDAGFLHPIFFLFICLVVVRFIYLSGRRYFLLKEGLKRGDSKNVDAKRAFFVFTGITIFATSAYDFLANYGLEFMPVGGFVGTVYTLLITIGIIRYGLFDVVVVIRRTVVFAGLFGFVYGAFAGAMVAGQRLFQETLGWNQWVAMVPAVFLIAISLRPLEKLLTRATERYLFQRKYDYKHILRAYIEKVVTERHLEKIIRGTKELLDETLHPEGSRILVLDTERGSYLPFEPMGQNGRRELSAGSRIASHLRASREIFSSEIYQDAAKKPEELLAEMKELDSVLAVPLILQDELVGLMLLGKKKSDEPYSKEDLDILTDLSKTEAIAIENARYVKELNATHVELLRAKTMQHLADMANGMSHQFNNRFHVICMAMGVLKSLLRKALEAPAVSGLEDDRERLKTALAQGIEYAKTAEANALRGGDIARGLLKYARPEKAGFGMQDLPAVLQTSLEMLAYKHADLPHIEIRKEITSDLPLVWLNPSYLQDILFIVLDNAYDAIEQRKHEDRQFRGVILISVSLSGTAKDFVSIRIKDNGAGMAPDVLEKVRLAVPYVTTKASSMEKSGYGSGIQVLRRLVSLHRGEVRYDSVHGEGTTVTVEIPVRSGKEEGALETHEDKRSPGSG
ncbi:MAG: GAF domain-containing protein [Candidatus Omnitrophica bacterium]|nr:GAF domain-containing protein [Candidatus Omnitrophota bacterium]